MRLLVFAVRDWSYANVAPALDGHEATRISSADEYRSDSDVIITCEPDHPEWTKLHAQIKGRCAPTVGMQQGLYWSDDVNPNKQWPLDRYFVWGAQMYDVCMRYRKLNPTRIRMTGCPRFDEHFAAQPENEVDEHIILGSGGEDEAIYDKERRLFPSINFKFMAHPNMQGHQQNHGLDERLRRCRGAMIRDTGAGIIPMIYKKPVRILPSNKSTYLHHPGYAQLGFSKEHELFLSWAIIGPGSTERFRNCIDEIADQGGCKWSLSTRYT